MESSEGCLATAAGVSATFVGVASFVFWRRGLVDLGLADGWAWPLAVAGTVAFVGMSILIAHVFPAVVDDVPGTALLLAAPVVVGVTWGYRAVLRRGGAPAWMLDPPAFYEAVWADPPWPARTAISVVVGLVAYGMFEASKR